MYAIVKTGGKQYRVSEGQSLLVERLPGDPGSDVSLEPLLFVDGSDVVDAADGLASVVVSARVVGHERGPKLRVVKFKPKRGYKRRTGHRQELTRIEVTSVARSGSGGSGSGGSGSGGSGSGGSGSGGSGSGGSGSRGSRGRSRSSSPDPTAAATPAAPAETTSEVQDGS